METNTNVCVGAQNKPKDSHVSQSHCLVSQKRTTLHTLAYCSTLQGANAQIDMAAKSDYLFGAGGEKRSWRPALWSWMILGQGCIQRI